MEKILVRVSETFSRPSLKPGKYVLVEICKQVDFFGQEITDQTPFRSSFGFGPVPLDQLRSYILGLQHMSKFGAEDDEFIFEAPEELHELLLGVSDLNKPISKFVA